MPTFSPTTPRIAVTVAETKITAPAPYAEGQTLTPLLAAFLNRQVASAVANVHTSSITRLVKAGEPKPDAATTQSAFDIRYAAFEPGQINRASVGEPVDPIAATARRLATQKVEELLRSKGKKVADIRAAKRPDGSTVFSHLVDQYLAADPSLLELAKAIVAQMAARTADPLGDLDAELAASVGADTESATTNEGESTSGPVDEPASETAADVMAEASAATRAAKG